MKFQKTIDAARKSLFALVVSTSLVAGIGMLKTTVETSRRENVRTLVSNFSANYSSIFQFPLTEEEKREMIIPTSEVMRLYMDCNQRKYNDSTKTLEYVKTHEEVIEGVERRRRLENLWTRYFNEQVNLGFFNMHPIDVTSEEWYDPLNGIGWFQNSFNDWRPRKGRWRERHEAIDYFAHIGTYIHAPVSGVVIASANDWRRSLDKKTGLYDINGGLNELAGNGILLFNPADRGYYYMVHMKDVSPHAGDVVSRGEIVGTVGRTGNAIFPGIIPHDHFAYKIPRTGCGVDGVLVAQNPYWKLMETRTMFLAQRNGNLRQNP